MISAQSLTYCYPRAVPLRFPDVQVPQGAILLLTGPSGCGKSTWLALVAGLVPAGGGRLVVADQDLALLQAHQKDRWRATTIGFLPQKLHLSTALTVAQNLALAQWAAGQASDSAAIVQCLRTLGVDALADRKPTQISGGQAQRVALARAVLLQPKLILADEPTANLDDAAAQDAIHLLLHTAQRHRATLVVASHDARVKAFIQARQTAQQGLAVQHLVLGRAGLDGIGATT